jgi:hypothetical protein
MNIFYLHNDPKTCAEWHVDKHVSKMLVEYAQLMSTAHRVLDGDEYIGYSKNNRKVKRWQLKSDNAENLVYKACHVNHPSAIWVRQSVTHYKWMYDLWCELHKEFVYRYGKSHASYTLLSEFLATPPANISNTPFVEPPQAMKQFPQCMVEGDSISAYRNFYREAKKTFANWKKREVPYWYEHSYN